MSNEQDTSTRKASDVGTSWLWSVVLVIVGIVLLLDNFLLLGDFDALALLPLLLVIAGAQILLQGDIIPGKETGTFGITRGSVESATLEISSADIDVEIGSLQREGRLIAGQYAPKSRPKLNVQGNYTHLVMKRAHTPWMSFADWRVGVAQDLPWQFLISTSLGRVDIDLSENITHDGFIATGFGNISLICPPESFGIIYLRSTLGNIHVVTPAGYNTRIVIDGGRMFTVKADIYRYENPEPNVFLSTEVDSDAPLVEIHIGGTFGDAYLS